MTGSQCQGVPRAKSIFSFPQATTQKPFSTWGELNTHLLMSFKHEQGTEPNLQVKASQFPF